ncbi:MAG: hypothetical protein ACREBU_17730, partial [Nitrososphaera sp.]
MMERKQVVLKKIGDRYTSAVNSKVVDMDYSKDEFISKGFKPMQLSRIPEISEQYIVANHPEFQQGLRWGTLQISPINAIRWSNERGEYFDEIDYKIVRTPGLPEEEYVVQEEPPRSSYRTPQNENLRRMQRQLAAAGVDISRIGSYGLGRIGKSRSPRFEDFLGFYHDPIYVFYEKQPGSLR